jgi:uncharacterized protein (UPF0332 family)
LNELKNCFLRRQLLKVEPSLIKSERSIQESYKWLNESFKNIEGRAYSSAQLSTYLVFFHAARAVLYRDGVREKSHYCIGIYLEAYQKEGLLEENWIILFDRVRNNRHAGQYSFQVEPTKEEVELGIKSAENFLKRIIELLRTTEPFTKDLY